MKPIRILTLIAILFFISEVQAQKIQLLTNPDFEDGTNGWWHSGANVTSGDGVVNFDITNPGTNPWDVQLGQGNFTLKTGYKYTLTWRAKRESDDLAFILALGEEPYTSFIYDKREGFNGAWQESSMEYTHTEANISNIGVTVQMGGSNANATIDYIYLTEEPVVSEDYNQYFTDYNSFITKLTNLTSSFDSATALNVFWSNLVESGNFPFAIGNKVAFLYRGSASSVSWKGGFNEWNANADPGVRLGVSNIWLMEKILPSDARSGYKIVINGNDGIADPHNPYPVSVEWGNSDLRMPDYEIPFETIARPSIPKGSITENILKYSSNLKYNCQYKVYTPAGYNELSGLPVMFVTDGHDFSDDEKGQLKIILDNLIYDKQIEPLIAVFLDPRDPNDLSRNRRSDEYRNNINFVKYVTQELIPDIDAAYKTNASPHARAIAGYSYGGYNAAYFCAHATEYIKKTAILSPIMHPNPPSEGYQIDGDMLAADLTESKIFMSYGIFDTREIVFFKQLRDVFVQKGKEFLGLGVNDGHSFSNWSGMIVKGLKYLFGPEKNKVKITFQVDMKDQTVSGDGVFINGNFSNWQKPIKMQANGTTYFVKLLLDEGALIEYKFMNGNTFENISGNCTNGDYKNRYLTVPESDNVVNTVCFNSCSSCTGEIDFIGQSFSHPGNLPMKDVPQFVCLSFDDNLQADGVEWLCNQVEGLKNPDRTNVGLSFYFNSKPLTYNNDLVNVVNSKLAAYNSPHEVGNHTYDHPHNEPGRTTEEWKTIIEKGIETLVAYTRLSRESITNSGFRAPYLETSDEMYIALNELGVRYDHSSISYRNSNNEAGWPYTLSNNEFENKLNNLWKVPISDLIIPDSPSDLSAYGIKPDTKEKIGFVRVSAGDYDLFEKYKLDGSTILGLLKYNLDLSIQSNKAPFTFCFHSQYYSEETASVVNANSNTTLLERRAIIKDFIAYCQQQDKVYLSTVNRMLDWMENPVSPEVALSNPGTGPVSYYGEMQTSGNRIIGERTQQPMQVKGISFFWSIWGGEKFWTPGAVNALVDDWDVELIRAPMSVEEDDNWGTEKGYLNPLGKQVQIENMERMVQAAIERDIYIIIDFHSHEAHLHTEEAKEFFGYMAEKYGSYDNVIFEIYNEPIDADWPTIKAYAETVIESIREYSDNLVIVGTEFYSQRVDNASMSPINDINTAYVFHFYASHGEELRQIVRTALNNNIPLFASEWGNINVWGDNINRTDAAGFKNSDDWHELMDENMISSANWAVFAENKLNANSTCLHKLGINELSKTGENWNDTSIMTESGKYVYNMLKEQAKVAPWRKAENTTTVQVTFSVNMNDEATSTGGVFIEGSFNNWESKVQMTANESVYSVTLEIPVGEYVEYRFRNGNTLEEGVGGECFGWDNNRLLIVPETDISLDAVCFNTCSQCIVIETFNVEAFSSPVAGGVVSGSGEYNEGTDVTLTATPNEGYEFLNWTKDGFEVSENQTLTLSVTEDLNLQANFKLIPSFIVNAVSLPSNGGTIAGAGTFNEGTEITLTAISNEGYEFIGWTDNGAEISAESSLSINVSENINLQANFKLLTGIDEFGSSGRNIQVFPNPTSGHIVLNGLPDNGNLIVRLYNSKGKLLDNKTIEDATSTQLNLEDFKSGMYYLVIKGKDFQKVLNVIKIPAE
jgi:enterochelin esterase-like enzyme